MTTPSVAVESPGSAAGSRRLAADDWLRAGLESIARRGVGSVRIGCLAAELGVTSGSFYWHFKSRDRFLDAVLRYWLDEVVAGSLAQIAQECPGGKARLLAFVNAGCDPQPANYDRTVWAWALDDERAARGLDKAARHRIARLRDWFAQEGITRDEAELRSELLYRGWFAQQLHDGGPDRSQRGRQYLDILLR